MTWCHWQRRGTGGILGQTPPSDLGKPYMDHTLPTVDTAVRAPSLLPGLT